MIHSKRTLLLTVIILLAFMLVAAGCAGKNSDDQPQATGQETATPDKTAEPVASPEERVKLSLFMTDSGIGIPDGYDPNNNPIVDMIEAAANADLEIEVPGYTDYSTKLDLMLSSGQLADLVMSDGDYKSTDKAAQDGAFLDIKELYDNSPIVQKVVPPNYLELAKASDGHYYRIPMVLDKWPQGSGLMVRYDMLKKYNNGKWPETVEEWVVLYRTIHKAEPDSIIMTNRGPSRKDGFVIFYLYGAVPHTYRVQDGKAVSTFQLPEYREALEITKQLYAEGIFEKEFATNDGDKWWQTLYTKNLLASIQGADQVESYNVAMKMGQAFPGTENNELLLAPHLKTYPSVLKDKKYIVGRSNLPIAGNGLYISSKTQDPKRAWRVIEALAADELKDAIVWGKEGETYSVQDGKRIPNQEKMADMQHIISNMYSIVIGYDVGQEVTSVVSEQTIGAERMKAIQDSVKAVDDEAKANGLALQHFVQLSEEASALLAESNQFIYQATVEAIMGKISMAEFDKKVEEYASKYGFIYNEYTTYMNENRDDLRSKGVVEVDW